MTDPVPGAGDDKTNQQSDPEASPVTENPPAVDASAVDSAAGAQDKVNQEPAHDGASETAETIEQDSDEEEEDEDEDGEDEDDEEEEEDEEPRLKYARLTQNLAGVYKNADATSAFLVAGDKMVRRFAPHSTLRTLVLLTSGTDCWNP